MTIVAGGDSFIWGCELLDHKHGGMNGYSRNTFTSLLAGTDTYICAAYPGIGNREVVARMINTLETLNDNIGVLVNWTWQGRDNVVDSDLDILVLQRYLVERDIPYMFTCADNCIVTDNPEIDYSHWFFFPRGVGVDQTESPRGFYQWAIENKYPIGSQGHPLEQAHKDAYDMMQEKFNELVKKHLQ